MAITKATASSIAPAVKGDLVVGSATNDAAVLGVGANNTVLTADSAEATGLKWATPAGGGSFNLVTPTSTANSGGSVSTSGAAVTASSVNSVSLNGVFTSTYSNYFITVEQMQASTDVDVYYRLRASGTDATSNYYRAGTKVVYATGTTTATADGPTSLFMLGQVNSTKKLSGNIYMYAPQLSANTNTSNGSASRDSFMYQGGYLDNTTSYDGITIYPSTGTLSCIIRVYGLAN